MLEGLDSQVRLFLFGQHELGPYGIIKAKPLLFVLMLSLNF